MVKRRQICKKPTIAELERLLDEEARPIQILPNGEVRVKGRKTRLKPITLKQPLGGEYASA